MEGREKVKNVKVKEFTLDLQNKIKERIKENFDLEVKQVNIKIDSTEKVDLKKEIQKKEEKKTLDEVTNVIEIQSENNNDNE